MAEHQTAVNPVVTPAAPVRPDAYDAATRAALDHIDDQALKVVADKRPANTRRGYAQDWASWTQFCAESGVPLLAVTPGTLVMFTEWLWNRPGWKKGTYTAPSTIDRRITGTVVTARSEHGVKPEDGVARLARNRLKQLVKEMETNGEQRGRGQAPPLLVDHLTAISPPAPTTSWASATGPWSSCTSPCLANVGLGGLVVRDRRRIKVADACCGGATPRGWPVPHRPD
ncbi:hypothetical protein ACFT7S_07865 [Streptomyces sp. NPDC057136]|uniref:hypothetical protein n=1 Tax=Streptomyces sp. NPDC057136 TaxID=3346029 RepID=UPI0036392EA2